MKLTLKKKLKLFGNNLNKNIQTFLHLIVIEKIRFIMP
jgi:hypothetical protein